MGNLKSVLLISLLVAIVVVLLVVIYVKVNSMDEKQNYNIEPEAGPDRTAFVGDEILFVGRNDAPQDSIDRYPAVLYVWDFDDDSGTWESGTKPMTGHIFDKAKDYTVTFTIKVGRWENPAGTPSGKRFFVEKEKSDTLLVTINKYKNDPPVAKFTVSSHNVEVGDLVQFDASPTTDSRDSKTSLSYSWDLDNDGMEDSNEKKLFYNYAEPGEFIVTLTVTDTEDASDTASDVVYVTEKENPDNVEVELEGGGQGSIGPNNAVSDSSFTLTWDMTQEMADGLVRVEVFVVWKDLTWDLDLKVGKGTGSAGGEQYASDDGGAQGTGEGNITLDVDDEDHIGIEDDEQWFSEITTKEQSRMAGGDRLTTDSCDFTVRVILWYV